ncbi:PhiH1 repressor [Halorussus halobius]|uniref:PhiH1 repressor n=1 Tax=Halorussus halobius TaxID=1710537 RepID=UPI001FCEA474|nr:PhiH1 repressor [Halorussus halobius]
MSAIHPLGDQMRKTADWMSPSTDDRILEVIREKGNMTPLALSREGKEERIDIGRKYAGERCRELARYGLLCKIEKGLFGITDKGQAYLDEELDASTLDPVDDSN